MKIKLVMVYYCSVLVCGAMAWFGPPPLKRGEVNFKYLPRRVEESEKLKKEGGSMVQRQVVLKRVGGGGGVLAFSYFPI